MINFPNIFPKGDDSIVSPSGEKIIVCAMDAEWLSNHTMYKNLILSYQFSVINLFDGSRGDGIYYPDYYKKERLSFTEVLNQIASIVSLSLGGLRDYTVIIIAHNAIAEWTTLSNKKKIAPLLQQIRKTVITSGHFPRKVNIYDKSRNKIQLKFMLKDTMLLVPEKYRSLKNASALVDPNFAKLDIGTDRLSDMLTFLQEEPAEFEAYAIRDTQVTLKLWITLQSILNSVNGTDNKIYSTLSSASVGSFKAIFKENHSKKEAFDELFRQKI